MTIPLTPADSDLRDFPHTPMFRARLFGSSFHARATDSEWRAGVTLWLKSWDQVPAGSLPDDDIELCRLAELARDLKTWKKVREGALRGWGLCDDGRLYHPVVAEGINNAIAAKAAQRAKTAKARIAALEKHLAKAVQEQDRDAVERLTEEVKRLRLTVSQSPKGSSTESVTDPVTESKGEEKGEGEGFSSDPKGSAAAGASAGSGRPDWKTPDPERRRLWKEGGQLLLDANIPEREAREFLGLLAKDYPEVVREAVDSAIKAQPPEPKGYLIATCKALKSKADGVSRTHVTADETARYLEEKAAHQGVAAPQGIAAAARAAVAAAQAQRAAGVQPTNEGGNDGDD